MKQSLYHVSVVAAISASTFWLGRQYESKRPPFEILYAKTLSQVAQVESTVTPMHDSSKKISQIMKYGFPSLNNIRSLEDFVLSYDTRNRVPYWVMEHLTADSVRSNEYVDRSKCEFHEDLSIHPYFRSVNSDYKGSGYDRGHLAAAGNHKSNQTVCQQTFVLSNMAPQVGKGFNRDIWNRLEKYVRKLTKKYPHVYVCTGPLYLPRVETNGKSYVKYEVIGSSTVAVPSHFFKVILAENADFSVDLEAYVLPNQVISDETPLVSFRVPLESIQRASGLLIFEQASKTKIKSINGKTT